LLVQYFFNSSSISGYQAFRASYVPIYMYFPHFILSIEFTKNICAQTITPLSHQTNHTTKTIISSKTIFDRVKFFPLYFCPICI
jgi:hypothetical protein